MSPEDNHISLPTLRAELAQLELRLVDRLTTALDKKADHAVLEQVEARVAALELARAGDVHVAGVVTDLRKDVNTLQRFRYAVPSTAVAALLVAAAELARGLLF